jgi:hypothetical protein
MESIPEIKDCNGGNISDPVRKANIFNKYYASVFSCERDIQKAWRALHFVMCIVNKGNKNTKSVAFSNMGRCVGTHTENVKEAH